MECYQTPLNALPMNKSSNAPREATIIELKLNPEIPTPKIRLPKYPPIKAPNTPSTIDPKIPPLDGRGSIRFATEPAIIPSKIQAKTLITLYFSPPSKL